MPRFCVRSIPLAWLRPRQRGSLGQRDKKIRNVGYAEWEGRRDNGIYKEQKRETTESSYLEIQSFLFQPFLRLLMEIPG